MPTTPYLAAFIAFAFCACHNIGDVIIAYNAEHSAMTTVCFKNPVAFASGGSTR